MTRTLLPLLAALATLVASPALARPDEAAREGPYTLDLVDEWGTPLPTFHAHGRVHVLGQQGRRYALRFRNGSARRVEVVASVDGRDVVDGEPSSLARRGYVVEPYGELVVDGFRVSAGAVAAFRFASVARSYAARMGDARDVGVIGLAVFAELAPPPPSPSPWRWRADGPAAERSAPAAPSQGGAPEARGAAPEARAEKVRPGPEQRPGLGTEFGEERSSPTYRVSFVRASERPEALLTIRYDDRRGLVALGIDVDRHRRDDREARLRATAEPFRRDGGYARPPPGWDRN